MKLSYMTWICPDWELGQILKTAQDGGYDGIELRTEREHKHGVEIDTSAESRQEVLRTFQDAGKEIASIATSLRYGDPETNQGEIDRTPALVDLARDLECRRIRIFGRMDQVELTAEALAQVGEVAKPANVILVMEMHGADWDKYLKTVELANHPNVALLHNSDPGEMVDGSIRDPYSRYGRYIRHVHIKQFDRPFPYSELLQLLKDDGYQDYLSAEIEEEIADPHSYLLEYADQLRKLLAELR